MRHLLVFAFLLLPGSVAAQAADILVEVDGIGRTLTVEDLATLRQDTVRAASENSPFQVFVGWPLSAVLNRAGARLDSLRGRALAQYVVVEGRDRYQVVFSLAELSSDFTSRRVLLAHTVEGQRISDVDGPWRLIVEGERRPARWVRRVSAIRLLTAPTK